MKRVKNIQKGVACFMLILFVISSIPKKYFHDLFFDHIDYPFQPGNVEKEQLSTRQFNCGFVNAVAITPFLPQYATTVFQLAFYSILPSDVLELNIFEFEFKHFLHRGPPVFA